MSSFEALLARITGFRATANATIDCTLTTIFNDGLGGPFWTEKRALDGVLLGSANTGVEDCVLDEINCIGWTRHSLRLADVFGVPGVKASRKPGRKQFQAHETPRLQIQEFYYQSRLWDKGVEREKGASSLKLSPDD